MTQQRPETRVQSTTERILAARRSGTGVSGVCPPGAPVASAIRATSAPQTIASSPRRRPGHRRRQRPRAGCAARAGVRPDLHGPAVQHRAALRRRDTLSGGRRRPTASGSGSAAAATALGCCTRSATTIAFADYLDFLEPRLRARPGAARSPRDAVLPHRLPRGPLLQAAARRGLRSRGVPQRADLEPTTTGPSRAAAGRPSTTRSSSTSGPPVRHHFDRRRGRARAVHGARASSAPEKARAWQAADRRVVSHDRADQRAREDRLPDAEARGRAQADRRRIVAPGRRGALTRSPARERSGPCASSWAGGSCSSIQTRWRSRRCMPAQPGSP